MVSDDVLRAVAFVKRAKNRRKVLEALQKPALPSEVVLAIFAQTSDSYFSTVSRALTELCDQNLAQIINPEEKTGRTYRLTQKGTAVLAYLRKNKSAIELQTE
jgi:Fe2+ or Zn2+ uptake regulation protein